MAKNLHIRRRVALRESALVRTPMVLGYLKPMILFPVGLVNGLSGEQVESILAHELAHIKRHDYLINLLTSIIEILMFFNPAIWWLTSRIKAEREHCCDDLAIDLTGDAVTFVKTLAHLEDWRTQHQQLGLAMTGKNGSVLGRIQRLLHQTPKHPAPLKALLSVLCVAMVVGLFAFQTPAITPPVEASAEQIEPTEDVEEIREEAPTGEDQQAATEIREVAKPNYEQETPAATPQRDTVPQDIRKLEEDMRKIEAEMREKEIAMEKQEQLLRKQMLEKEKALQVRSYEMQKKMMELQMKEQALENSMQLRQHELEMNHSELREKELELEQQAAELERKAEALEQGEENTSIEELRKVNAELQTRKSEFLKKQRDLEKQMMSKEKEVRLQTLELRKQAQEMEEARYLLESELEGISREEQYQMQEIQQKMEALSTEQMLLHRELEKKHRELEARHEQLQEKMEQHEEDGFDGAH